MQGEKNPGFKRAKLFQKVGGAEKQTRQGLCFKNVCLTSINIYILASIQISTHLHVHKYMCTYTRICIYTYTHMYRNAYRHKHIQTEIHANINTRIERYRSTYTHLYIHAYIHTYFYTYMYTCIHKHLCTHVHTPTPKYMCAYVPVNIFTWTHARIDTCALMHRKCRYVRPCVPHTQTLATHSIATGLFLCGLLPDPAWRSFSRKSAAWRLASDTTACSTTDLPHIHYRYKCTYVQKYAYVCIHIYIYV